MKDMQRHTIPELTVAYLESDGFGYRVSKHSDEKRFSNENMWTSLREIADLIVEEAYKAASLGISDMSFGFTVIEDMFDFQDPPDVKEGEFAVISFWEEVHWESDGGIRPAQLSIHVYANDETCKHLKTFYRHGAVDAMKFLIDEVYKKLTCPFKIGTMGTDFASVRWIPIDFEPGCDDNPSLIECIKAGIPLDDVFAAYNTRSL